MEQNEFGTKTENLNKVPVVEENLTPEELEDKLSNLATDVASAAETSAPASEEEAIANIEENAQKQNELEALRSQAKWYALHTFTGYEQMVEENLKLVTEKYNLGRRIFDIIIPMEDVIEEKRGKRKIVSRKLMPGYVLVKMIYGDDIWHNVTRTRGITGFVGPKGRPLPLSEEEVTRLKLEKIKVDVNIKVGDKVEIVDGPLISQIGDITFVDKTTGKVKANVNMFGRVMVVDLDLSQIRKI